MGLNFSHCEARWSYGGFHEYRKKLAKEAGIPLMLMEGFYEKDILEALVKSNELNTGYVSTVILQLLPIPWESLKPNDIHLFLNHSDCDGELSPDECKKIIPALRGLTKNWAEDDRDKSKTELLIEGMQRAIEQNESFEFY